MDAKERIAKIKLLNLGKRFDRRLARLLDKVPAFLLVQKKFMYEIMYGSKRWVMLSGGVRAGKTYAAIFAFLVWIFTKHYQPYKDGDEFKTFGICSYQKVMIKNAVSPAIRRTMFVLGFTRANTEQQAEKGDKKFFLNTEILAFGNIKITFHALSEVGSMDNLLGSSWHGAVVEETTRCDVDSLQAVQDRCSETDDAKIVFLFNPKTKVHPFYERWWKINQPKYRQTLSMLDNKFLPTKYIDSQLALYEPDSDGYKQQIEGKWTDTDEMFIYAGTYQTYDRPSQPADLYQIVVDYARKGTNAAAIYGHYQNLNEIYQLAEWKYDGYKLGQLTPYEIPPAIGQAFAEYDPDFVGKLFNIIIDPTSGSDLQYPLHDYFNVPVLFAQTKPKPPRIQCTMDYLNKGIVRLPHDQVQTIEELNMLTRDETRWATKRELVPAKDHATKDHLHDCYSMLCWSTHLGRKGDGSWYHKFK